jgi:predicted amidohydrolase
MQSATAPFRVAAIQMVSEPAVAANLALAEQLIADATEQGAKLVVLPEWFCFIGAAERDKLALREQYGEGPIQSFLSRVAARFKVWLIGGTLPLECGNPNKVRNACFVFDDTGRRVARYDKIHLFDFTGKDEAYKESNTIEPGDVPLAIDSPFGRLGLSVCYDVRFPELYRRLAPLDLISVPSAFTATTGAAHWEVLLRARAVENLAWVIAPAQGGRHSTGRVTHGHTMVVDPWGEVVARRAEGPGIVVAEIDPKYQQSVRERLPALSHRVL